MKSDFSTIATRSAPARPWSRAAYRLLHLGALASLPALAASDQVLRPHAGYAMAHDDNLLGIGASDYPATGLLLHARDEF